MGGIRIRPVRIGNRFIACVQTESRRLFRRARSRELRRGHQATARTQREISHRADAHGRLPDGDDFRSRRQHHLHSQAERQSLNASTQSAQTPNAMPDESKASDPLREHRENADKLLHNIKGHLPKLKELLARVEDHWGIEDGFYRFYHQSFKVYHVQQVTAEICEALQGLWPDRPMNRWFAEIVTQGTGREFEM